jgi:hypothetical protein
MYDFAQFIFENLQGLTGSRLTGSRLTGTKSQSWH